MFFRKNKRKCPLFAIVFYNFVPVMIKTQMEMYLHEELETLTRTEIEALQFERLLRTVRRCMKSPFYQKRFAEAHLSPEDIRSLDDLRKIPFTTKQDLRDNYPFGLAAVPMSEVVRLHSSGYGMFTGGLGFQYGAERLGMLTVPAAAGNTKRQIKFITDFGTTALHAIPSYASRIHEVMEEMGIDPVHDTKLRTLVIGAEPHSEEQRRKIEKMLGVKAYNSFGMSEMCGPGVAFECTEQNGMHIWEDYYIVEIVDPQTLEPVPDGEVGELVLTTINREAIPLLRYRTRDLTRILPGDCPCGRHHKRLDRMKGRSDDMMILKGVNIFPIQIETVLMQFEELGTDYLITLTNEEANDLMTVEVELKEFSDDYPRLQALTREITRQLKDEILLTPVVRLVPKGTLPKQEGKAVRVRDLRRTLI